jgi:hypothetical protein
VNARPSGDAAIGHEAIRAALFVRVTPGDPSGVVVRHLRHEARRRGWTVAGEYVEVAGGPAGRTPERDRLVGDVRLGRIDALVVDRLGQLGRSLAEIVAFVENLRGRGIGLVSVGDAIDTTAPGGGAVLDAVRALAQAHRDLVGDRARVAIEVARRRGSRIGRPPVPSMSSVPWCCAGKAGACGRSPGRFGWAPARSTEP